MINKTKIIRIITGLFGAALTLNGILLFIFANFSIGILMTLLLGLLILLPSIFWEYALHMMHFAFFKVLAVFAGFCCVISLLTTGFLYIYGNIDTATYSDEDYLIVLGCGVRGERPTSPLVARLDKAIEYLEGNKKAKVIVTGGQGNGEDISEAEAMYRYLTAHGIDGDRILKEDKATSTSENFKFSNRLVDNDLYNTNVVFITNDFHIYRAASLARMQGFNFRHISAKTSFYNIFPCYLREMLALMQMVVFNR